MCTFSYADFAVLFNNLACLDTSYWIMFFELKIHIILWVSRAFAESCTLFSALPDPFLGFGLASSTMDQVLDPW